MIIAGDQSPLAGGLLRYHVLRKARQDVLYNIHDTDAPWVTNGGYQVSIVRGWTDYWALAARFPWSPDHSTAGFANAVAGAVRAPRGLGFISGPPTRLTIRSVMNGIHPLAHERKAELVADEVRWARRLLELAGRPPAFPDLVEALTDEPAKPFAIIRRVGSLLGGDEPETSWDFFRRHPSKFAGPRTGEWYWIIDREGVRRPYGESAVGNSEVVVPRGKMLPIEDAAAGHVIAATQLGYIEEVKRLRDRIAPGLEIPVEQITFCWQPPFDPFDVLWGYYTERKRRRGQTPDANEAVKLRAAVDYWQTRPTVISWAFLGGDLHADIKRIAH